jgi:hypothetical protein
VKGEHAGAEDVAGALIPGGAAARKAGGREHGRRCVSLGGAAEELAATEEKGDSEDNGVSVGAGIVGSAPIKEGEEDRKGDGGGAAGPVENVGRAQVEADRAAERDRVGEVESVEGKRDGGEEVADVGGGVAETHKQDGGKGAQEAGGGSEGATGRTAAEREGKEASAGAAEAEVADDALAILRAGGDEQASEGGAGRGRLCKMGSQGGGDTDCEAGKATDSRAG